MKKIITMLFLGLLVSSVFATDWVKYETLENEEVRICDIYFDFDATEPFDINNESIRYFLFLQGIYEAVEVSLENIEDRLICSKAVEHNCYAVLMEYGDCAIEEHINKDDTITQYTYWKNKEEE